MTGLRLGWNHLRDRNFKQFSGRIKIFFENFWSKVETWTHRLLHYYAYRNKEVNFLDKIKNIGIKNLEKSDYIFS